MKPAIPKPVLDWVKSHCGSRTPRHAPRMFTKYANSRTSDCWGSHGGIKIDGYRIAVCQPTPNRGSEPVFLYDFIKDSQ